jgi:hypothetical protein
VLWTIGLAMALGFRLTYGLASMFWTEDERQIFLIGLRSYARREWPFYGADVVWTHSRLPGALQAMLVRLPLALWHAPESPFVLLNLLSFAALALFAWYCRRRLPSLPGWFVWGALLLVPWTLNFSTHIVNTSYILPGAIVFFVGFFEGSPMFRAGVMPEALAWACMGAGLLFLVQIHMSWVLLPAYVAYAVVDRLRVRAPAGPMAAFAVGAGLTGAFAAPTFWTFGWQASAVAANVQAHIQPPQELLAIAARFLSFPAYEITRFLGLDTAERLLFVWREPWVVPFLAVVLIAGTAQPIVMAAIWPRAGDEAWTRIKWLALLTVVGIYVSFFLSVRDPLAHAFYVVFPVAALYTFHGWQQLAGPKLWRTAALVLGSGVAVHAGIMIWQGPRRSLYLDRPLVEAAVALPNDRLLGDRRDTAVDVVDHRPRPVDRVDPESYANATMRDDLVLSSSDWTPAAHGIVSAFALTIENRGRSAAYLDVRFVTTYRDAAGREITRRDGVIKQILEPGDRRSWRDVTNGLVPAGAASATVALVSAEKAIPWTRSVTGSSQVRSTPRRPA